MASPPPHLEQALIGMENVNNFKVNSPSHILYLELDSMPVEVSQAFKFLFSMHG